MRTVDLSTLSFAKYKRKSDEAEDRQVLSIQSQDEVLSETAKRSNLNIKLTFYDEASAKIADNRPGFSDLMQAISQKEINAILVWKPNRLARNMIEAGQIMDLLQQGKIKAIVTPNRVYFPQDNILMLAVEFGQAKQFSSDLSEDVKRGNRTKILSGGFCNVAPQGYLNSYNEKEKQKTIIKDPERFALIRKMWELYLSGNYSIEEICEIANKKWVFKTIRRRKQGGKPMSKTTLYRIFKNPFYYGLVRNGENEAIGKHPKMVSEAEFRRVQRLLLRQGRSHNITAKYRFLFKGIFHCETCHCSMVAEEKRKYFCPKCRHPRTAKHPHKCPKCNKSITQRFINKSNHYIYYSCSKKRGKCDQRTVREDVLENQIIDFLMRHEIDKDFIELALKWLNYFQKQKKPEIEAQNTRLKAEEAKLKNRLQNLLEMRLDGEVSNAEYKAEKTRLESSLCELKSSLKNFSTDKNFESSFEKKLSDCLSLVERFKNESNFNKRECLMKICPNPTIKNCKACLNATPLYFHIIDKKPSKKARIEPPNCCSITEQSPSQKEASLQWSSYINKVRTLIK